MEQIIISALVIILIFLISALPLHISVKILGGRTNILKSFLITLLGGVLTAIIAMLLPYGQIIALIVLIWLYHEMFRLKWIKALIAWILQMIFIFLLGILATIFGIGLLTISIFS